MDRTNRKTQWAQITVPPRGRPKKLSYNAKTVLATLLLFSIQLFIFLLVLFVQAQLAIGKINLAAF